MAKKRKNPIKKIAESRKVKRVFWGILAFFAVICLGTAFSEKAFRASVNIEGFDAEYLEVSSSTRKALRSELDNFVLLNTGNASQKTKFKVREDQELVIAENEDREKYSAFYIDSDDLQISALVQMNWAQGFSDPDASFIVRIDCVPSEESKYENAHCYSHSTGESASAFEQENLGLLEAYNVSSEIVEEARGVMLSYLKIAYPEAKMAFIDRASIEMGEAETRAELKLDNGKSFTLAIATEKDWSIQLQSGENVVWETDANKKVTAYRHYSALSKLLPIELEVKSGARFVLNYGSKDQLIIGSVKCTEKTKNSELEQAAKTWLKANNFEAEAYEIKLKNSCGN